MSSHGADTATYAFSFDGEPESREVTCPDCGEKHDGKLFHRAVYHLPPKP